MFYLKQFSRKLKYEDLKNSIFKMLQMAAFQSFRAAVFTLQPFFWPFTSRHLVIFTDNQG